MKSLLLIMITTSLFLATATFAAEQVVIETSHGKITVLLNDEKAPLSVANFLAYVDAGHYQDTIFHRVIKNFMIQGGNVTTEMSPKKNRDPIRNEAGNGLRNLRGTIAMARTGVVDSATSQFFINLKDNDFLDHKDTSARGYGYAVFGAVTEGMDVVDRIAASPTHTYRGFSDVPVEPVIIQRITRATPQ